MRHFEFVESRPWKHYGGQEHTAYVTALSNNGQLGGVSTVEARYGLIHTGRSRVFFGWFVEVNGPSGETWLGEHRYSLRGALRDAARQVEDDGWSLSAVGLTRAWRESGLSENSGYGYHPGYAGAVHMLERLPE